jgi:hypothetical protein
MPGMYDIANPHKLLVITNAIVKLANVLPIFLRAKRNNGTLATRYKPQNKILKIVGANFSVSGFFNIKVLLKRAIPCTIAFNPELYNPVFFTKNWIAVPIIKPIITAIKYRFHKELRPYNDLNLTLPAFRLT